MKELFDHFLFDVVGRNLITTDTKLTEIDKVDVIESAYTVTDSRKAGRKLIGTHDAIVENPEKMVLICFKCPKLLFQLTDVTTVLFLFMIHDRENY